MKKLPYAGQPAKPKTRDRWWERHIPPDEFWEEEKAALGDTTDFFEGDQVSDFNWPQLTDEEQSDPTFDAVVRADYNPKKKKYLVALIEHVKTTPLSDWGRKLVSDFMHRRLIRTRQPIYQRSSAADVVLQSARREVDEMVAKGVPKEKAIDRVAKRNRIPLVTLENSVNKGRASTRRARKDFRGAASPRPSRKKTAPE